MPIDPAAVGNRSEPTTASWDSTQALTYALGVGAGVDELAFTTENTDGAPQQVLPTFAVTIGARLEDSMPDVGTYDLAQLVHAEQRITLHRPLPVAGTARLRSTVVGIWDKGKAAIVASETEAVDAVDGTPLFTRWTSSFIRGEGGWGGDRGPSGPRAPAPGGPPDVEITEATAPDQALRYRLSGDRNRLHSDPAFAADGGFPHPILHGLCTYGYAGRALLHGLCGSDPARFEHIEGRFTAPFFPGDSLTTRMWRTGDGEAAFTVTAGDGTLVIDQGRLRFGPDPAAGRTGSPS
jgi:acyl dehydratase